MGDFADYVNASGNGQRVNCTLCGTDIAPSNIMTWSVNRDGSHIGIGNFYLLEPYMCFKCFSHNELTVQAIIQQHRLPVSKNGSSSHLYVTRKHGRLSVLKQEVATAWSVAVSTVALIGEIP